MIPKSTPRFLLLFAMLSLLVSTVGGQEANDSDTGSTWIEIDNAEQDVEPDSLPRLGAGSYLDYGEEMSEEERRARSYYLYGDSLFKMDLGDIFLPAPLEMEERRLQDILLESRLPEEENYSLHDIFRQDSLMAISLMQLREDEYPHYHMLSNLWVYIWRGRGSLLLEEGERDYAPGQFFQIPAGTFHSFHNISGAPTVSLIWQSPPVVDSLIVEIIPEEVLMQMRQDSLRLQNLQDRSIYKSR